MQENTKRNVFTALHGLAYSSDELDQALFGKKRASPYQDILTGPFALALTRVAEVADGAPVAERAAFHQDMLFLFDLLPFLRGGFYDAAWSVLSRAHTLVAERLTKQEAAVVLGQPDFMVDIEVRLCNLYPITSEDGTLYYARYQVEALKGKLDAMSPRSRKEEKAQ